MLRKRIIHAITLITYGVSIYSLFFVPDFWISGFAIGFFYVAFHFSIIELKHEAKLKHFFLIMLAAATLLAILLWWSNRYFWISIYLLHTWIFLLAWYILEALQNRKKLSTREVVHIGWYLFTVFLTLTYGTLILAIYPKFPFTCEQIYENSDKIVETLTTPFSFWHEKIASFKDSVAGLSTLSVWDALWVTWSYTDSWVLIKAQPEWVVDSTAIVEWVWIIWFVDTYKQRLVDQVIADNNAVKMNVCELMVWEITDRYDDPVFQFSLILLLFILFYPFLRVIVFVTEVVGRLILKFLVLVGIYKFSVTVEEIDDVM